MTIGIGPSGTFLHIIGIGIGIGVGQWKHNGMKNGNFNATCEQTLSFTFFVL